MCGILGVASTEGLKNRAARLQFLKMGLDIDSWRGWESTGLALVTQGSLDNPIVYKRALNGRDFIQLNQVEKYLNDIEKYSVAIGHNRAATTGRGSIIDRNAHPFQYGDVTLVHNGHIRNTHQLKDAARGADCLVDSAHVAYSMAFNGEKETLETVDGGFVFVWWNSKEQKLNIARNTERPLHFAFAAKENTLYWASEVEQLLLFMKGIEIDEDAGLLFPAPWNWYQFDLKNLREYTKTPFAKRQGRQMTTTNTFQSGRTGAEVGLGYGWTDEQLEAWEAMATAGTDEETTTSNTETSSTTSNDEIEDIRQELAMERIKDIKQAGVPSTKKRLDRAKAELKKLDLEYGQMKVCDPVSWCKYRNQDNLGSLLARIRHGGQLIEIIQVRHNEYLKYDHWGTVLVDCVNVRYGPNNEKRVIGVVRKEQMAQYLKMKEDHASSSSSTERVYDGPGGMKISRARFLELTTNGCGYCEGDLDPILHGGILWVGSPPSPICPECQENPAVVESLGIQRAVH